MATSSQHHRYAPYILTMIQMCCAHINTYQSSAEEISQQNDGLKGRIEKEEKDNSTAEEEVERLSRIIEYRHHHIKTLEMIRSQSVRGLGTAGLVIGQGEP